MKITGVKKLNSQLSRIPKKTQLSILATTKKTAKMGYTKAKAISPVKTGDLVSKYSWHAMVSGDNVYGFVNFHDGTREAAIKFGAVNYGRSGQRTGTGTRLRGTVSSAGITSGYGIRENVIIILGKRHKRSVQRQLRKAIEGAMNG